MGQTLYEAENAALAGPVVANSSAGFTGTGYADYVNASGDYVEFTLGASSAGSYPVAFRYANGGTGNRPLELKVNGAVAVGSLGFPVTGGWTTWAYTATNNVTLNAGLNTVRITATGSSGGNVDHMLVAASGTTGIATNATFVPLRRPISPSQPMWLVHIDSWNFPDPQKVIDLVPADIRPYVVMNISLSISHTTNGQFQVSEYGYEIARSWLRVCAQNQMWAMIQCSSGGYSQFSDYDLSVYEEFYREYPNLIGFNYAEQFWGYDSTTDPLSAAWTDRITHFANVLKLSSKYGGYLVVSWCGNQWSPSINPIGMLKRNAAFAAACRNYTKNYILCEKYTQQSYQSDMESICLGAYLSGFSGQYGIRYDSTGWTDVTGTNQNFTLSSGGAPHLEHVMLTGETVIDGPELIWQQCFRELSAGSTSNSYTMRRWDTYPQFNNVMVDIFRKILDGTVRIPSRQEVIDRSKYVIINDVNSGTSDDIYSTPTTLFEGLYRMDGDGNLLNNKTFFKKTGRYPTVPTVYQLNDAAAQTFPVKVNKSGYSTRWPTITAKTNEFNTQFPQEYTGDLYAGRHENGWVVYNPYKSTTTNRMASGIITNKYNTCDYMELTLSQYSSGVIKEYATNLTFYLNNYDNDLGLGMRTETLVIHGSTFQPAYSYVDRASHTASIVSSNWSGGVFTLTVQHNGPLDITVNCAGTATGRLTSYTSATVTPPAKPLVYNGPLEYEAEVFDYKSVAGIVTSGWSQPVRNYSGQGYLQFGTSSSAAVREAVTVPKAGAFKLQSKYSVTGGDVTTIDLYVNGSKAATPVFTQTATLSDWAVNEQNIVLNAGANTIEFRANATGTSSVYFDNIVVVPTLYGDGIVIQENGTGFTSVDGTIDNNYPGYTGDGFANTSDTYGASINWNAYFDSSAIKSFTFRYAGTNAAAADLIINGANVAANIQFPATASWSDWAFATVYAYAPTGVCTVKLQSTSPAGLPNIDSMEVIGGAFGPPGKATNPSPANGAAGVAVNSGLIWTAGSNAVAHAVYLGTSSNAVAQATSGSAEFSGLSSTTNYTPSLVGGLTYYWRVDEIAGVSTNPGPIWSFTTMAIYTNTAQPLADSYVESSTSGSNYGSSTNMLVKNNVSLATRIAYLMFDARGMASVRTANLMLMPNRVDDSTVKMYYGLASTNWTENGITWNNQPASTGVFFATNTVAVGVPVNLDVTSAVANAATNGGLLSIRITQPTNSLNGLIQFCSREHPTISWRPMLTCVVQANTPPALVAISDRTTGAGTALVITNSATDVDIPAQTLTYSLLTGPSNATINASSGVITWRPWVTQANTTNPFTVIVTDNGTPSMSATQSFAVTVNPLAQPQISTSALTGGQMVVQVNGPGGPDYQIQASTNLTVWSVVFTTNSPAMPFTWTNSATGAPMNFFRIRVGPPFP